MNLSLDNPYGNVSIPRAKLRSPEDGSVIIGNPMAVYSTQTGTPSALNPYGSFRPQGELGQSGPQYQAGQNLSAYQVQPSGYTVKDDEEEEVSCCYACWCCCCRRCRRRK